MHAATDAAMVWAPVYGSGYPFGRRQGTDSEIDLSAERQTRLLDTDHAARVDAADDPYGPYYPGDDAVDWVGLFLYRFGAVPGRREATSPRRPASWPPASPRPGGTAATAPAALVLRPVRAGRDQPMLLETSALYNPAVGGADELRLKRPGGARSSPRCRATR